MESLGARAASIHRKFFPAARPIVRAKIPPSDAAARAALETNLNPDSVLRYVAQKHGVGIDEIVGKARDRHIVDARQDAAVIMREQLRMELGEIAEVLGGRDHTSVVHYLKRAKGMKRCRRDNGTKYYQPGVTEQAA